MLYDEGMNIHFICRGNVLRSLIAETYLKSLQRDDLYVTSSGTNVDWSDAQEKEYFANTLALLDTHGIRSKAKDSPDQLTQSRADGQDVTVFMNQRVVEEASKLAQFNGKVFNWGIVDIGEGDRTDKSKRTTYQEEIYDEITSNVDELVAEYGTRR